QAGEPRLVVSADPELGQVRSGLAVLVQELDPLGSQTALGVGELPTGHGQGRRLVADPQRPETRRDDPTVATQRCNESLAARQVPERGGSGEIPVVRNAGTPTEVERQIRAQRAGDVRA